MFHNYLIMLHQKKYMFHSIDKGIKQEGEIVVRLRFVYHQAMTLILILFLPINLICILLYKIKEVYTCILCKIFSQ